MKIYRLNQLWLNYSDNLCLKSGKNYARLLMKDMKWNDYGILEVRTGLTSINIVEVVKRFVVYTQKIIVWVSWLFSGKMKEQNLKV